MNLAVFQNGPPDGLPPLVPPDELMKNVFIPTWDNRPATVPPVIQMNGITFLTHQNIAAIIAKPGAGKSSNMEAIISSYLNSERDNLGYQVSESCKGIIYIDNERTNIDVWNSFYRTCRRAGIEEGQPVNNVVIAGLRSISRLDERRKLIEHFLDNHPCSLLLLDGAGDLVLDTNDLQEAGECRVWMRALTAKYDISIVTTLHPNPNSEKPRGHQGSEICREAESVLILKSYDENTRIITSDFEHGKNRNNAPLTAAFRWSDNQKMFISVDYDSIEETKLRAKEDQKRGELIELAKSILPPPTALKNCDLINAIRDREEVSEPTANRQIKSMREMGIIKKHEDGYYRFLL